LAGEDSFAWSHGPGGLLVAVTDGLGTIAGSAGAAARAASAAVQDPPGPGSDLGEAVAAGIRSANVAAGAGGEGATTLVLAAMTPDGRVEAARVGDSTAFHVDSDGTWREIFAAPDDDAIGTGTDALPGSDVTPGRASLQLAAGDVLVVASDGVADPWRDGPASVAPYLVSGVLGRPSALELARLADFSRQGCHDDRTVVCVWLSPATYR
jgi:serine/threonine protein phosphatase PrpC